MSGDSVPSAKARFNRGSSAWSSGSVARRERQPVLQHRPHPLTPLEPLKHLFGRKDSRRPQRELQIRRIQPCTRAKGSFGSRLPFATTMAPRPVYSRWLDLSRRSTRQPWARSARMIALGVLPSMRWDDIKDFLGAISEIRGPIGNHPWKTARCRNRTPCAQPPPKKSNCNGFQKRMSPARLERQGIRHSVTRLAQNDESLRGTNQGRRHGRHWKLGRRAADRWGTHI